MISTWRLIVFTVPLGWFAYITFTHAPLVYPWPVGGHNLSLQHSDRSTLISHSDAAQNEPVLSGSLTYPSSHKSVEHVAFASQQSVLSTDISQLDPAQWIDSGLGFNTESEPQPKVSHVALASQHSASLQNVPEHVIPLGSILTHE